jgi:hypothetical protein
MSRDMDKLYGLWRAASESRRACSIPAAPQRRVHVQRPGHFCGSTQWTCGRIADEAGILIVAETAGYITPQARRRFYAKMDAANVDLKAFTDEFYVKVCGARLGSRPRDLVYHQA